MKQKILLFIPLSLLGILTLQHILFNNWLSSFKHYASQQGITDDTLQKAFKNVAYDRDVIKHDRMQTEKIETFDEYYALRIIPYISEAKRKLKEYHSYLMTLEKQYGVPAAIIIAIWCLESKFGKEMGSYNVIQSLATLAYDDRRSDLFKRELIAALHLLQDEQINPELKGTWAGAMGQNQLLPSVYRTFAVDGNQDGKKDIWLTPKDVLASIAHYLHFLGWMMQEPIIIEVKIPNIFDNTLMGLSTSKSTQEWSDLGIKITPSLITKWRNLKASLMKIGAHNAFLAYHNFGVLMRWNHSQFYAFSICLMAKQLENRHL